MKKLSLLLFISSFLIVHILQSQTIIPGGDVTGNWAKEASPYLIEGEINIPLDQTLTIEPGVEVKFNGHYKFIIYGCLLAEGNVIDSIIFTTDDTETGWHGLRFTNTENNSQPTSYLSYCIIEYGKSFGTCPDNSGGGIYVGHSAPVISNNTIRHNSAVNGAGDWGGGGIYSEYAIPIIKDNLVTGNYSGHDGGGIYCCYQSPLISNNQIINNEAAYRGGGIAVFSFASPDILNNEIVDNQAGSIGGGLYQSGGNSLIQSNIFSNNYAGAGGGIACYLSNSRIYNNLLVENEAYRGAGLWNQGSSPNTFNNTVIENIAYESGGGMYNVTGMAGVPIYSNPLTANNILYMNSAEDGSQIFSVTNNIPILWCNDIEGLMGDGIYGDFNQQEGNMDVEPHFDSEGEHECALSDDSECIDNGLNSVSGFDLPETDILGNNRIWDGDSDGSSVVDMGAYEYGSSPVGIINHESISSIDVVVAPNPFVNTIKLSLKSKTDQHLTISLYTLSGKRIDILFSDDLNKGEHNLSFTLDWLPSGIYLLRVETDSRQKSTSRIIKIAN